MAVTNVGENVAYEITKDRKLVITIDLDHRASDKPAEGKKTIRVATTGGNKDIPGSAGSDGQPVIVGINAYVYPPR